MIHLATVIGLATRPRSTASMLESGHRWLVPFAVTSVVALLIGLLSLSLMKPLVEAEVAASSMANDGAGVMQSWERFATVGVYLGPALLLFKWLFNSAVIYATCVVCGFRIKFLPVLNIVGYCALFMLLQEVVVFVSIYIGVTNGSIRSLNEIAVPLGVDMFLQTESSVLRALAAYFTPMQIWSLVACGLAVGGSARVSPAYGLAAVIPMALMQVSTVLAFQFLSNAG